MKSDLKYCEQKMFFFTKNIPKMDFHNKPNPFVISEKVYIDFCKKCFHF